MCLCGTHPYHALGPLKGPLQPSKGLGLAPKGPFGGPRGPRRAVGSQIWSQLPPIGPSESDSWSTHTATWYRAPSGPKGALKGLVLALKGPFGGPRGPWRAKVDQIWSQLHLWGLQWFKIWSPNTFPDIRLLEGTKGPNKNYLDPIPKLPRPNFFGNSFCSKYRLVGCPDRHSRMPGSSSTVITHMELPSLRKQAKRVHLGPERPLLGPQRSSEGSGGADLVPTAPHWPAWVEFMATTHFDLVSGPFWSPGGPKRARFGTQRPF